MPPYLLSPLLFIVHAACAQPVNEEAITKQVGGPCEGCEAIYENDTPFNKLPHILYLPGYAEAGPRLQVYGVVYKADGKTPAPGVVLYLYHTDQQGYYSTKGNDKGWGKRHGHIRGWLRTNEKGEYKFITLKPAAYPNRKAPAHIHATIKEPGLNEYYIDEYLFDDDPLLTQEERGKQPGRAGNGILVTKDSSGILVARRDIYLGRNIPGYPK